MPSNNAYQVEDETQQNNDIDDFLKSHTHFTQLDDEIIALSYIIDSLKEKNINAVASILKDVLNLHFTSGIMSASGAFPVDDEYNEIVYSYFAMKYFNKIKLDKYKKNIIEFINSADKNNGIDKN